MDSGASQCVRCICVRHMYACHQPKQAAAWLLTSPGLCCPSAPGCVATLMRADCVSHEGPASAPPDSHQSARSRGERVYANMTSQRALQQQQTTAQWASAQALANTQTSHSDSRLRSGAKYVHLCASRALPWQRTVRRERYGRSNMRKRCGKDAGKMRERCGKDAGKMREGCGKDAER